MSARFEECVKEVLKYEGGFSDNVNDPGGATNFGISLSYARSQGSMLDLDGNGVVDRKDILLVTEDTAKMVYRNWFWKDVRGDDLPAGVDLAVFDFAVNSGSGRAIRFLQTVLGVESDGVFGPKTLEAVRASDPTYVVNALCIRRLQWLQTLGTFATFGRGWTARVNSVQSKALDMVGRPRMTTAEAVTTDTGKGAITTAAISAVAVAVGQAKPAIEALGALTPWLAVAIIVAAVIGVLIWRTKR